jgi:hypothetical protein
LPQFKDASQNFYNEYFAARVLDQRGGHVENADAGTAPGVREQGGIGVAAESS